VEKRTYKRETSIGQFYFTPESGTCMLVSSSPLGHPHTEWVTVNGVRYFVSGHLYLWKKGVFLFGKEEDQSSQIHEPMMVKVGVEDWKDQQPTFAALRKTREVIIEAVIEWVVKEGRMFLELAELAHRQEQFAKAREHEEEIEIHLEQAKNETVLACEAVELQNQKIQQMKESQPT
jgi:hypothetical protein